MVCSLKLAYPLAPSRSCRNRRRAHTLFTTVRMLGFLSRMTWPMRCLWGVSSSRMLRCAMWPTVSNELGTSDPSGSSLCRV